MRAWLSASLLCTSGLAGWEVSRKAHVSLRNRASLGSHQLDSQTLKNSDDFSGFEKQRK